MIFRKICVFLDLTEMDSLLVRYASFLADLLQTERTYFIHAFESSELPAEVTKLFPELDAPLDEVIAEEIGDLIQAHFSCTTCATEVKVQKDDSVTDLLEWAHSEDIDLMVLGKKPALKGSGTFARKIVKLSYTSVFFLPETARPEVTKILAPVDFSNFSKVAFSQASHIAELRKATLTCQHVYKLPTQYFPFLAATDEKLQVSTKNHVEKELDHFLKKVKVEKESTECVAVMDEKGDVAKTIYSYASDNFVDLIVLGPKGASHGDYFLLGNVCEKLLNYNYNIKMLIAKDKKDHDSLISEIFGS